MSVAGPETNGLIFLFSWRLVHNVGAHHTTPSKKTTKHRHHGPHNPLAPSCSDFIGKCNCRKSCDQSQLLHHGDAIFIDYTNWSVILLTILLISSDQCAQGQKVSFWSDSLCFFTWPLHQKDAQWPQLLADILFAATPRVLVVFRHDFGLARGGAAPSSSWYRR